MKNLDAAPRISVERDAASWHNGPLSLRSLWTVITTDAKLALEAVIEMDDLRREIERFRAKVNVTVPPTPQMFREMKSMLEKVKQSAEPLGLTATLQVVSVIAKLTTTKKGKSPRNAAAMLTDIEHLRNAFTAEMGAILFLYLNPERVKYMVGDDPNAAPFGQAVFAAFPSAAMDIREASNAYALERWPACVFHLMRVLEFGLTALAARFGVTMERPSWHEVIEAVEGRIRKITPATEGPNWKRQQKEFSDAATQFMFFKDAWRNHVMHVRDIYDEGRTMSIWQHVDEFMNKLAAIGLKEPERP